MTAARTVLLLALAVAAGAATAWLLARAEAAGAAVAWLTEAGARLEREALSLDALAAEVIDPVLAVRNVDDLPVAGGHPAHDVLLALLSASPHLDAAFLGFGSGDVLRVHDLRAFTDAARDAAGAPAGAAFESFWTWDIRPDDPLEGHGRWVYRDDALAVTEERAELEPRFDARGHLWYAQGSNAEPPAAGAIHALSSSGRPGFVLTAPLPGPRRSVLAFHVSATWFDAALRESLAGLDRPAAAAVQAGGRLVAVAGADKPAFESGLRAALAAVDPAGGGFAPAVVPAGGGRVAAAAVPLPATFGEGPTLLLLSVPVSAFQRTGPASIAAGLGVAAVFLVLGWGASFAFRRGRLANP